MFHVNYTFFNRFNFDYDKIRRPFGSNDYLFLHFAAPMKITLNHKTYITKENAFILFNKGTPQIYSAVKTFQNSFIHFRSEDASFIYKYKIPTDTILYFSDPEPIIQLLQKIHLEYFLRKPLYENMLDAYINELLIHLSRSQQTPSDKEEIHSYLFDLFQRARHEILSHITYQWTSESMATLTNLGTSQFYQYYQKFFNSTPKADLLQARINHAKKLLSNEKMTVSEVAQQSGFQNASHFARYFKKQCGVSPLDYAKNPH